MMINNNLVRKVEHTIESFQMIDRDDRVIVGVSGGSDSMVLLDILTKLIPSEKLIVAHLNHMFRGEEAKEDAVFVKEEANKRNLLFEIKEYNVTSYMKETGLGSQEAAREIRYKFYKEVAKKHKANKIALGHHINDQAETVLMRFLRGTGPHGLAGIPYKRKFSDYEVIRPLLDVTKVEIEEYCDKYKIPFRLDKSNLSTKYERNKIRLEVIPFLEKYNHQLTKHLYQLGKLVQEENNYLEKITKEYFFENAKDFEKKTYIFNVYKLQKLDIALQRRLIHLILRYLKLEHELTYDHVELILQLIIHKHPSKSIDLPGIRVYRNYEEIIFTTEMNIEIKGYRYNINIPGNIIIPEINKAIKTIVLKNYEKQQGLWAVFDYDKLDKDIIVRTRKNGDRLEPFGMNGSKKVKDLFIDQKIPIEKRNKLPIFESNNIIIWIPGIKRSNYALIDDKTRNYLYITLEDA